MEYNSVSMLRIKCPYCDYKARNPLGDNGLDLGEHFALAHRFEFDGKALLKNGFCPVAVVFAEQIISGEVRPT